MLSPAWRRLSATLVRAYRKAVERGQRGASKAQRGERFQKRQSARPQLIAGPLRQVDGSVRSVSFQSSDWSRPGRQVIGIAAILGRTLPSENASAAIVTYGVA